MLSKGVLIGLELREFERLCPMRLVFPLWQNVLFGKNQSYEVLNPTNDMLTNIMNIISQLFCDLDPDMYGKILLEINESYNKYSKSNADPDKNGDGCAG